MFLKNRKIVLIGAVVVIGVAAFIIWNWLANPGLPDGIATGNGRIEGTEIAVAALAPGRIADIQAAEGDFVTRGDTLVQMDITLLEAQKRQAEAALSRAEISIATAESLVLQTQAQRKAADAAVEQAQAVVDEAAAQLKRSQGLAESNVVSRRQYDTAVSNSRQANAALTSAQASLAAAEASVGSAEAQVVNAKAAVESAKAQIDYVASQIADSTLKAPRNGRIQYVVAQVGEVVGAGGRILNLVDLSDVYMTFFLPTAQAGLVSVGAEARLVMDAARDYAIPATVSYVADVAQFTPKTVLAPDERDKLMFRVRARVDADLLRKYIEYVKTGLPGDAYVRIDPDAPWPSFLSNLAE